MAFEHYVRSGQKLLRCGYTTGTCAALAAAGAAEWLLAGEAPPFVKLSTPKGLVVEVPLQTVALENGVACCSVIKDGGDDADVTDGLRIRASVQRVDAPGIFIDGGEGVGRVTQKGLDQPVGAAAINHVPRAMIQGAVEAVCQKYGSSGGLSVVISVPGGAETAQKTFNPHMGIVGGISILGTSGVVEPMSLQAIVDTTALEIRQARANGGERLILTPGNYGRDFLREQGMDNWGVPVVVCSNFIGEALDAAAAEGFRQVLLVGHIGKLVKLAGGIMNTHSRWADCRTELFCAHAAVCGADTDLCNALLEAATADACIALLDGANLRAPVLQRLLNAAEVHLSRRAAAAFLAGAVFFSNQYGPLGATDNAQEMINRWK